MIDDTRVCAESAHSCLDLTWIGFCNENFVNTLNSKWQQKHTRPHEAAQDPGCANSKTSCEPGRLVYSGHVHSMPQKWLSVVPLAAASDTDGVGLRGQSLAARLLFIR